MRKTTLIMTAVAAAGLGILVANTASAQDAEATFEFNYDLDATCTFAVNPIPANINTLEKTLLATETAEATILTNLDGAFTVSLPPPAWSLYPAGMVPAEKPTRSWSLSGANSAALTHSQGTMTGSAVLVNEGTTNLSLTMAAGGKDMFTTDITPGAYQLDQVVRCVAVAP